MKKTYRSFFCLLAVLLLSVSALPAASALFSERLYYYGTVEEISRAADGTVESVLVAASGRTMTKRPPPIPLPLQWGSRSVWCTTLP